MFVYFRWRPGKARGVRRPLYGNCRTKDMEVGGGRPILARSNVDSVFNTLQYCLEMIFEARLLGPRVLKQEHSACFFTKASNGSIQMQILICNPTSHVTQSLITRNVCRIRFERVLY